jgi:hypothetical protein
VHVLFFLRSANLDRLFAPLLETLLERGHEVTVVVESEKALAPGAGAVLERLASEHERCTVERLPTLPDGWRGVRRKLRVAVDVLRYLEPEYREATALRERARSRASRGTLLLERPLGSSARARSLARRALHRLERAVPVSREQRDYVAERRPDLVLVSPLVSIGSPQADWIRIADELGVPSVLPVASWDNLSNKGVVKHAPSLTVVWNEAQAREAVALHGLSRERVLVAGAHSFDHWFATRPSTTRAAFASRAGLPDERPFLLYVCSSRFVAGDETGFVREWVGRLRESEVPALREAAVLVRPHPLNREPWEGLDRLDPSAVVWPEGGAVPTDAARRAGYFDSLHHAAAVVGVNTSALIETAIAGRPVFTLVDARFRGGQEGTLHFAHIADDLLVVARSWDEHLAQLAAVLEDPELYRARLTTFLERFVRPGGLDRAAAPVVVEALERLASRPVAAARRPRAEAVLRSALLGGARARRAARGIVRTAGRG